MVHEDFIFRELLKEIAYKMSRLLAHHSGIFLHQDLVGIFDENFLAGKPKYEDEACHIMNDTVCHIDVGFRSYELTMRFGRESVRLILRDHMTKLYGYDRMTMV